MKSNTETAAVETKTCLRCSKSFETAERALVCPRCIEAINEGREREDRLLMSKRAQWLKAEGER